MKNLILFLAVIPILQLKLFAQEGWFEQTSGTTYSLHSVHFADENVGWAVGDNGTILKTTNGGDYWFGQTSNTTKSLNKIHCIDSNTSWIIGGTVVLNTTNGGAEWTQNSISNGDTIDFQSVFFIDNNIGWLVGNGHIAGTGHYEIILKTVDGGEVWIEQDINYPDIFYTSVCFINADIGWVSGCANIYNTTNGGEEWSFQHQLCSGEHCLSSLQFTSANTGWVISQEWSSRISWGDIWKTTDGGENWISKYCGGDSSGLPIPFCVNFVDNDYGWAIADNIILATTNGGDEWTEQLNNPSYELESIYFVDNSTGWAVGGNGLILKYQEVNSVREEEIGVIPTVYDLSNNYPNPFNPTTKIKYSIPQSSNVLIKVFDILGNEIETLVNAEKPAGTYEITWYAERLPSGVYFYRLQAGSFVATKKMLLLK